VVRFLPSYIRVVASALRPGERVEAAILGAGLMVLTEQRLIWTTETGAADTVSLENIVEVRGDEDSEVVAITTDAGFSHDDPAAGFSLDYPVDRGMAGRYAELIRSSRDAALDRSAGGDRGPAGDRAPAEGAEVAEMDREVPAWTLTPSERRAAMFKEALATLRPRNLYRLFRLFSVYCVLTFVPAVLVLLATGRGDEDLPEPIVAVLIVVPWLIAFGVRLRRGLRADRLPVARWRALEQAAGVPVNPRVR
jgi:hypothetical protein